MNFEHWAKQFHDVYERLAPSFGHETRKASAVSWENVPENNRELMIAVCAEVGSAIRAEAEAERDEIRHKTVTQVNKLLGLQSRVDLERWEQLEVFIRDLQAERDKLREELQGKIAEWRGHAKHGRYHCEECHMLMAENAAELEGVLSAAASWQKSEQLVACSFCEAGILVHRHPTDGTFGHEFKIPEEGLAYCEPCTNPHNNSRQKGQ